MQASATGPFLRNVMRRMKRWALSGCQRRRSWFSSNQWPQVEALLKRKWSPKKVSYTLKEQGIYSISHETIYRYILKDKKTGGNLYRFMRIMPKKRRKRYNS